MLKVLFIVTTRFHLRASDLISKSLKDESDYELHLLISSYLSYEQKEIINKRENVYSKFYNYSDNGNKITKILSIRHDLRLLLNEIKNNNYDIIFTFSDNSIINQVVINNFPEAAIIYFEEGTGAYLYNKMKLRTYIGAKIKSVLLFEYKYKPALHCRSGLYQYAFVNFPSLFSNEIEEKFLIPSTFHKSLYSSSNVSEEIRKDSVLIVLSNIGWETNSKLKNILLDVFTSAKEKRISVYLKPHPASNIEKFKELASLESEFVKIIDNTKFTSEDYCLDNNIELIITDFSSTVINAYLAGMRKSVFFLFPFLKNENIFLFPKSHLLDKLATLGNNTINSNEDLTNIFEKERVILGIEKLCEIGGENSLSLFNEKIQRVYQNINRQDVKEL